MTGVFGYRRPLAEPVFRRRQNRLAFITSHQHGNDFLIVFQIHAANTTSGSAHRTNVVFIETNRLARIREKHDVVFTVRQGGTDQVIAFIQPDSDNAGFTRVAEIGQ